jgi:hypothetical protein
MLNDRTRYVCTGLLAAVGILCATACGDIESNEPEGTGQAADEAGVGVSESELFNWECSHERVDHGAWSRHCGWKCNDSWFGRGCDCWYDCKGSIGL